MNLCTYTLLASISVHAVCLSLIASSHEVSTASQEACEHEDQFRDRMGRDDNDEEEEIHYVDVEWETLINAYIPGSEVFTQEELMENSCMRLCDQWEIEKKINDFNETTDLTYALNPLLTNFASYTIISDPFIQQPKHEYNTLLNRYFMPVRTFRTRDTFKSS